MNSIIDEENVIKLMILEQEKSLDPKTQVGCVITNKKLQPLGFGHNRPPINWNSEIIFNWKEKHPYVIHAELSAISDAFSRGITKCELEKSSIMWVTLHPCNNCVKLAMEFGINEIRYFDNKHKEKKYTIDAIKLYNSCNDIILKKYHQKTD